MLSVFRSGCTGRPLNRELDGHTALLPWCQSGGWLDRISEARKERVCHSSQVLLQQRGAGGVAPGGSTFSRSRLSMPVPSSAG